MKTPGARLTVLSFSSTLLSKAQQKIVVACARELADFVWAIATDQPIRRI